MRDRLVNGCASCSFDGSGGGSRIVSDARSEGRNGDRARLACSESAGHVVRTPSRTFVVTREMLSTVPWGVGRSALHVGRREGDAMWHRQSDYRITPLGTLVKLCGSRHAWIRSSTSDRLLQLR